MLDTDTKRRIDTARDIFKNAYPAEVQDGPLYDPKGFRMRA